MIYQLIKHEILYNINVFVYIVYTSLFSFLVLHNWHLISGKTSTGKNFSILYLLYMFFFFIGTILKSFWWTGKRNRQILLLPVSIFKIAFSRIFLFIIYWITIIVIFIFFSYLSTNFTLDNSVIRMLAYQTGLILLTFSTFFIGSDLAKSFSHLDKISGIKTKKIIYILMLIVISILIAISVFGIMYHFLICCENNINAEKGLNPFFSWIYNSIEGLLILNGLGMTGLITSFIIYSNRKSYIH